MSGAPIHLSPARAGTVIGHIVRPADFERVLSAPTRARSPHFAVHHLQGGPSLPGRSVIQGLSTELSTDLAASGTPLVDDRSGTASGTRIWLGTVVPKRHARRAVTRSLIKRQMRAAVGRQPALPGGLWVLRLRAPFARDQFVSAASTALRDAARDELDALLASALRRSSSD